ncbi:MAG: gamma-glutamyltransferase family protein [Peptococcaceae bacterium]|jgi:gamma-glutamyltranspeptidase/glutathione hydrolase|nr:gamma-glutamyltransferase family protein [Peptococcaceae bacterium]
MDFDAYPYPSRRTVVFAGRGMVATSHPLAAQAGLEVLRQGGNAVDAAVAAAAALTVVEPCSNGIGGDAFALVWFGGRLLGLNASGPSPRALSAEKLKSGRSMPRYGWASVTVPGAPAAWAELSRRYGRVPLATALAPAVEMAGEGHPVAPTTARNWRIAAETYACDLTGAEYAAWFETFTSTGAAPRAGEVFRAPWHAATLRAIAASAARDFYEGDLAERILRFSARTGGYLVKEDLAQYAPEWVEPVSIRYRGYDVWEMPPNGQGLVALMALGMLEGFDFTAGPSALAVHRQLEAMKLAFADGLKYITDRRLMAVEPSDLLSPGYIASRRELIGERATPPAAGRPPGGGTVYLATSDGEGNMVSYIQSNYLGFGSGLVVPETGIALHNRGCSFSLDPGAANFLLPGKKPYHTIIPGFLTRDGRPVGPFGVMGAFMQPQGHVQVVMNMLDFQLNPQAALDAPRWQWLEGMRVSVEPQMPEYVVRGLADRGHLVEVGTDGFGRGQIIWRLPSGVYAGATEPRTDGSVAAW